MLGIKNTLLTVGTVVTSNSFDPGALLTLRGENLYIFVTLYDKYVQNHHKSLTYLSHV